MLIIYGILIQKESKEINPEEYAKHDHFDVIAFISLILTPIVASTNSIIVRKLRKINENTLSCYTNLFSVVFVTGIMLVYDYDFSFIPRII